MPPTVSSSGKVHAWNCRSPASCACSIPAAHVRATAWSPQGDRLAIASDDLLLVVSIGEQASEVLRQQVAWSDPVVCWAPDGIRLAVSAAPAFTMRRTEILASTRRTLWIYNTDTGQAAESAPPGMTETMAWSPVEDVIAYACVEHETRIAWL